MNNIFYHLECFFRQQMSRATFLKAVFAALLAVIAENRMLRSVFAQEKESGPRARQVIQTNHDVAAATGSDPYKNTVAVIAGLGGMERFVKKDATVVVKPNIAWDRTPEQAANTNPAVVAALVDLCYQAGARRVNVFDIPCNDARRCYERSGIQSAAQARGAKVYFADTWNVVRAKFPYDSPLNGWPVLRDAMVCDTFINVPVLKHHGLTELTLSMKNLMGVCGGVRGMIHIDISRKLADLLDLIRPELTVIDATRVLTRNGPSGGNLEDVAQMDTVFASPDAVLADAFACRLLKRPADGIGYIKEAARRGLGSMDVAQARVLAVKT